MKAVVLEKHGALDDLKVVEDFPDPKVTPGHVVIQLLEDARRLSYVAFGVRNRSPALIRDAHALVRALGRGDRDQAERLTRARIETLRDIVVSAVLTGRTNATAAGA